MAVVGFAQERKDSPRATFELNKHVLTRKFLVQTNSLQDGPIQVASAIGIPRMFSYYVTATEFNVNARCRSIECERVEKGSLFWECTCRFETPEPKNGNSESGTRSEREGQNDNPLLVIPEIETHMERYEMVVFGVYSLTDDGDLQYKPLKATNDEIFDPPPNKDASRLCLTITRNEDITSPAVLTSIEFTDYVNNDIFFGAAPGQVKCQGVSASKQVKQLQDGSSFSYLKVVYSFQFRPTWDIQILNAGNYFYTSMLTPRKRYQFRTDDGHPRKGLLDATGLKLADGANPLYVTFRPYPRKPFSLLNLPQNFIQAS